MADLHEDPSDSKLWKKAKVRPKVQKHIFEEDILPGCPVRENLPARLQHILYPSDETNTNETNANEYNAAEGTWEHERSVQYNEAEEQRKKDERTFIYIGPNGTIVSKLEFHTIHWDSIRSTTRSLLTILFDNNILETHTLSDKSSQERDGTLKLTLCPKKVNDIIYFVTKRYKCHECKVRSAIAQKCADVAQARRRSSLLRNYLSNS